MNLLADKTELTSLLLNAAGNIFVWQRFLEQLTLLLNCDSSALLVTDLSQPENTRILFNANFPKEQHERYETELNSLNNFNHDVIKSSRKVFCNQNLKDDHGNIIEGGFTQTKGHNYRFGLSIPLNNGYSFCLLINRKKIFNDL
jgi:hypothetical protein